MLSAREPFPMAWRVEQLVPSTGEWNPIGDWHDSFDFCINVMRDYVQYVQKYSLTNRAHQFRVMSDLGETIPGELFG